MSLRLEGLPDDCGARGTDLGLTVQTLVLVAQSGLPQWDWTDYGMVSDGMLTVFSSLYSCAATRMHGVSTPIDLPDAVDPSDELGAVLLACHARMLLAHLTEGGHDREVETRHLAVLAGVSSGRILHLVDAGEIAASKTKPRRIRADEARRWLAARGVAGYR